MKQTMEIGDLIEFAKPTLIKVDYPDLDYLTVPGDLFIITHIKEYQFRVFSQKHSKYSQYWFDIRSKRNSFIKRNK